MLCNKQGDVEAVASQSPKDLAKLIDQISGFVSSSSPNLLPLLTPHDHVDL